MYNWFTVSEEGRLTSLDASFTHKYKPLKGEKIEKLKKENNSHCDCYTLGVFNDSLNDAVS
jgi:hypothetical protein